MNFQQTLKDCFEHLLLTWQGLAYGSQYNAHGGVKSYLAKFRYSTRISTHNLIGIDICSAKDDSARSGMLTSCVSDAVDILDDLTYITDW